MKTWRFIDTGASDCYSNMAIDEALLEAYDPEVSLPVFRLYGWKPPAFSIGISQDPFIELDLKECQRAGIHFVRRITGGGVIFHDSELTYSIICSEKDMGKTCFAKDAYKILCSFLIRAYNDMGLDAKFSLQYDKPPRSGWVCFRQKERYDIVIGSRKIGGNAQRRKLGLIFQHGSIPVNLNPEYYSKFLMPKSGLTGEHACSLSQAMGRDISYGELKENILNAFKESFDAELINDTLTSSEKSSRDYLVKSKYSTKEWNLLRHADNAKALVA